MRLGAKPHHPSGAVAICWLALAGVAFGAAGCATPGPNHLYVVAPAQTAVITDHTAPGLKTEDVPSFIGADNTLLGIAYDAFTDHLFLRLAPGNHFRVVDRPDRSIKYEFTAADMPTTGGGDLAIRSLDRHLFLSHPTEPTVIEITLYGRRVHTIPLTGLSGPPGGVAYDQKRELIYALERDDPSHVYAFNRSGQRVQVITLAHEVMTGTLAFDSDAREFYVQLRTTGRLGVFGTDGHLHRTLDQPPLTTPSCFDVGPRSFLRLF